MFLDQSGFRKRRACLSFPVFPSSRRSLSPWAHSSDTSPGHFSTSFASRPILFLDKFPRIWQKNPWSGQVGRKNREGLFVCATWEEVKNKMMPQTYEDCETLNPSSSATHFPGLVSKRLFCLHFSGQYFFSRVNLRNYKIQISSNYIPSLGKSEHPLLFA